MSKPDQDKDTGRPEDGWSAQFRLRLKAVMKERDIKGCKLANEIDVRPNTIARWRNEDGRCGIRAVQLVGLSKYVGVLPAEWFLKCAGTTGVGQKLRDFLDYIEGLDEGELDHFLTLVKRVIDFAESRSAKEGDVAG